MPLVPMRPTSGAKRCMLPPRPCEQPVAAAEQLGDQLPRRNALGERVAVTAMRAEDDIVRAQMSADAGGDRLLADISVAGAMHQAALTGAGQLLLRPADEEHGAEKGEQLAAGQRGFGLGQHRGVAMPWEVRACWTAITSICSFKVSRLAHSGGKASHNVRLLST